MASSSAQQPENNNSKQVQGSGWGPPPTPGLEDLPPSYTPNIYYDHLKRLAIQEWDEYWWPTKKVQLAWRMGQWRNRIKQLVHSYRTWYALIDQMHRELLALEKENDLDRTPINVRQYLLAKWPRTELHEVLEECAAHFPQGIVTTRRMSTPRRDAMLEFIERQVDVGQNTHTADCTYFFMQRYGNI